MNRDESEIRGVLAEFTSAIRNKDAAAMIAPLAEDEVTFDLAPPLKMGPAQLTIPRRSSIGSPPGRPIVSESHDLTVAVGGDVAYAYGIQHLTGTKNDGDDVDLSFRADGVLSAPPWSLAHHAHAQLGAVRDGRQR